jgi:uncharacterized FlgJ-related protein
MQWLRYKGQPVSIGKAGRKIYIELGSGSRRFYDLLDTAALIVFVGMVGYNHFTPPSISDYKLPMSEEKAIKLSEELVADYEKEDPAKVFQQVATTDFRTAFIREKQRLIFEYTSSDGVSRIDQLSDKRLLALNQEIAEKFHTMVLANTRLEPHVAKFFTDNTDLNKLETALMEQAKFHVPASVKLAQAALETSYGRRVINNNYFGIKDKSGLAPLTVTTEYLTPEQVPAFGDKIISKKRMLIDGKIMYKCVVKDHFVRYQTPWESFRAHSVFLANNDRYAPLFTKGKKYDAWADKIGSVKYGGVGYATSPQYGYLLKKIIKRYELDLLDH